MTKKTLILSLCLGLLFGAHALSTALDTYVLHILLLAGIHLILSSSLNLINGYTGQFNLGHAGFMAIGAYSSAAFSVYVAPQLASSAASLLPVGVFDNFAFFLSLLVGGLMSLLAGLLVGLPTLRLRGDYLAMTTLGFGEIVVVIINNIDSVGGASGFSDIPERSNFFWIFACAGLTLWVIRRITLSTKGMAFLAVREDEIAAASLGISPVRTKMQAFAIGAFFAGVGGGLFAHLSGYLHVNSFRFLKSIEFFAIVVLGGLGNFWGVAASSVLLTVLPETLRVFAQWRMVFYSVLIILTMLIRSRGFSFKGRRS